MLLIFSQESHYCQRYKPKHSIASAQYSHSLPPDVGHVLFFVTQQLNYQYSGTPEVSVPSRLRCALLLRSLVTWQTMEVSHIFERDFGGVTYYAYICPLAYKWYLINFAAQTAQPSLNANENSTSDRVA